MNSKVKSISGRVGSCALLILLFCIPAAQAHNSLKESTPADKAVLHAAPAALTLRFSNSTYLVSVDVINGNAENVLVDFKPGNQAASTFNVPLPASLHPGVYNVHWMVEGDDTHQIKGDFSFTVDAMMDEHTGSIHPQSEHHDE